MDNSVSELGTVTMDIREGIAILIPQSKLCFRCEETICDRPDSTDICKVQFSIADKIIHWVSSQGVVKKVAGGVLSNYASYHLDGGYKIAQQDMIDDGYTLTEEL